ncbi:MAG: PIN domain-containing protein [Promethearchaeota archaeon]
MAFEKILQETKNLVLDTSVFIGYFMDEKLSIIPLLDEYVFNENSSISLYGHNILKSEIHYIICRKRGISEAENVIKKVETVINAISESRLFEKAGQIKCKYPIALSDCFSLSLGLLFDCPVFFLKERELSDGIVDDLNKNLDCKLYIVS